LSFYSNVFFPRLCDFSLNRALIAKRRQELLVQAHGEILEMGFGTGLNLPCYPEHVRKLTVVDPNPGTRRLAQERIRQSGIQVDERTLDGERLPFEPNSFDCVVSTFTLCSIEHITLALGEVYRVLKPGGGLLFLEHGLSPDPGVQRWQRRLNWLQMCLGNGCRLDRNIRELVGGQPFASVEVEEAYLKKTPRTHGYMYRGMAVK
jgi:ubiquinone/menaquinone biosynthesis C-methylase UbiE